MSTHGLFSRRDLVGLAVCAPGLTLLAGPLLAQEAKRQMTWPLPLGPFYPGIKLLDQDGDLTRVGKGRAAQGKVIHLMGRVVNLKGEPVKGARVEIWQADSVGRYKHPSDPNPVIADPHFQGFAVQKTDAQGRYRFKTVKPAPYPGLTTAWRTPHIHFDVSGKFDRVVTQMFFPGEPLNAQDRSFNSMSSAYRELSTAKLLPPTRDVDASSIIAVYDLVLRSG